MNKSKLIPSTWELPQEFIDRLGDRAGRQRVMFANGHLLFVLHAPPKPDQMTRAARLFWRKPDGDWQSTERGNGLVAFRSHLDQLMNVIDECDQREDAAQTAAEYFSILDAVSPLKRSAENLLHTLEEARKLLPTDRDIINFRDQAYDLSRTAELLYSAAKNGMEMAQTRRAEEQAASSMAMAKAAHRLNQFVAFFFPLATLTAVFGMQLPSGMESLPQPLPFAIICGVGILSGFIMLAIVGRRR
jgi:Mg2+ and Co2+ transporter CorA